jgi:hypothetical protein
MLHAEESHPIHGWAENQPVRAVLLGNRYVGKSTLLQRCAERCLAQQGTVRLDPHKPHMFAWSTMAPNQQQAQLQIQLTDLALQMDAHEARTSTSEALSDLHRVLDLVDLVVVMFSDLHSYQAVEQWIQLVRLGASKKYIAGLLVGNKRDLGGSSVSYEQVLRLASSYQMNYLHISATQSTDDVDTLMLRLASLGQKLLRYRCNLMLTDRPLCPSGCTIQSRHRHVFSEYHAEDPLGKVELDKSNQYEHDDSDDDSSFQQHMQPCSRIQPYWLRVALLPHPVPNLDSYPPRASVHAPSQPQMRQQQMLAPDVLSLSSGCSTVFCTVS